MKFKALAFLRAFRRPASQAAALPSPAQPRASAEVNAAMQVKQMELDRLRDDFYIALAREKGVTPYRIDVELVASDGRRICQKFWRETDNPDDIWDDLNTFMSTQAATSGRGDISGDAVLFNLKTRATTVRFVSVAGSFGARTPCLRLVTP